jgi:hypothetical protein
MSEVAPMDEPRRWRRRTAAGAAALLCAVAVFQVVAVFGAPVGSFTQGSQQPGALGLAGRVLAAVSAVLLVLMTVVIVGRVGTGPAARWPAHRLTLVWHAAVVIEIAALAANLASRSIHERVTFVPVAALTLLLTVASGQTRWAPGRTRKTGMTASP